MTNIVDSQDVCNYAAAMLPCGLRMVIESWKGIVCPVDPIDRHHRLKGSNDGVEIIVVSCYGRVDRLRKSRLGIMLSKKQWIDLIEATDVAVEVARF